jgi:hypothetical protein
MIEFFGNNNKNMNHLFCCWTVGKTLAVYQGRVYKQQEGEIRRPTVEGGGNVYIEAMHTHTHLF